ncbi:MAG: phosphatidylglycerophosphatase A [Proteobacteria bacterium]|nr:phosphatidylglycerophosphatase A [Pseudomonadota bacterium]MBS0461994.1 phosphatidylglycerophosphatase A [Pseudomonadota bacterium]MBS0464762.1 phosphatidylglycerophosphatase A [Pseudomonadota bacterium]
MNEPTPSPAQPSSLSARELLRHPLGWIASGLGSGFSPRAPGTAGTLAALLPWWFGLRELPLPYYLAVLVIAFAIGVWAAHWVVRRSGVNDPQVVVWDEFVGVWIALVAAPAGWAWMLAGFALFRVFDIWKPWPVRWADRQVHGGLGVMLDDVIAGIYALALMQAGAWFFAR